MAQRLAQRFCYSCNDLVRAEWSGCNHVLHLLLSLVTFGLWLPVWFLMAINNGYNCSRCGAQVRQHRAPKGWVPPMAAGREAREPSFVPPPGPRRAPRRR